MEEYKLALDCLKNEDYIQGQAFLKASAEKKYSDADYLLFRMYFDGGFGVSANRDMATIFFCIARDLKNPRITAEYCRGNLNEYNILKLNDDYAIGSYYLISNTLKSVEYYLKSANSGNFFAQYALFLLPEVVGYSDRVKWLKTAAKNGYWRAQYELSEHTNRKSIYWLTRAAKQRHHMACVKLAEQLFNPTGDWKLAAKYLVDGSCEYRISNRLNMDFNVINGKRLAELYQYKERTVVYGRTNAKVRSAIITWILIARKNLHLPRDIYNLIARVYLFESRENPIEWDIY